MNKLIGLLLVFQISIASGGWFGPKDYDECILENIKGVSDGKAAELIKKSCRSKFPAACIEWEMKKEAEIKRQEKIRQKACESAKKSNDKVPKVKIRVFTVEDVRKAVPIAACMTDDEIRQRAGSPNLPSFAEIQARYPAPPPDGCQNY